MKKLLIKIGVLSLVVGLCISTLTGCGNKKSREENAQADIVVSNMNEELFITVSDYANENEWSSRT